MGARRPPGESQGGKGVRLAPHSWQHRRGCGRGKGSDGPRGQCRLWPACARELAHGTWEHTCTRVLDFRGSVPLLLRGVYLTSVCPSSLLMVLFCFVLYYLLVCSQRTTHHHHSRRVTRMPQQRTSAPASPAKLSFKEKLTGRGLSSDVIQKKTQSACYQHQPKFSLSLTANPPS